MFLLEAHSVIMCIMCILHAQASPMGCLASPLSRYTEPPATILSGNLFPQMPMQATAARHSPPLHASTADVQHVQRAAGTTMPYACRVSTIKHPLCYDVPNSGC